VLHIHIWYFFPRNYIERFDELKLGTKIDLWIFFFMYSDMCMMNKYEHLNLYTMSVYIQVILRFNLKHVYFPIRNYL